MGEQLTYYSNGKLLITGEYVVLDGATALAIPTKYGQSLCVSKLAPVKLVGLMFGVWFVANFIANTAAGITGSYMDPILEEKGLTYFFMIFTLIPIAAGIVMLLLNKMLLKKMHGIR